VRVFLTEKPPYIGSMRTVETLDETFQPIRLVASRVGVPAAWLRAEAEAGRVPHLRAGRQILISLEQAEQTLLRRAEAITNSTGPEAPAGSGGRS
jgi:hypothetical protein